MPWGDEFSLFKFVKEGNFEKVKSCLANPKINVNAQIFQDEQTPLHVAVDKTNSIAVKQCQNDIVDLLLEKGANPNIPDEFGRTPLHHAAFYCNFEIIKKLLEKGANINARTTYGGTALDIAWEFWNYNIMKYLLENGADPNFQDEEDGRTIFMRAALFDDFTLVKILLENGVNINIKDNKGKKAVDYAKSPEVKKYIQKYEIMKRGPEVIALFQINSLPLELASLIADFDTPGTGLIGKKLFTDILMKRSENLIKIELNQPKSNTKVPKSIEVD